LGEFEQTYVVRRFVGGIELPKDHLTGTFTAFLEMGNFQQYIKK